LKPGKHLLELQHSPYYSQAESKYSFTIPSNARRIFLRIASPDNYFKDLNSFPANPTYSMVLLESPAGKSREADSYPWQRHDFYAAFIQESAALEEIKECRYLEQEPAQR